MSDATIDATLERLQRITDLLGEQAVLRALLDRWVYGNAGTEDLRQLCADTAAVLPPDSRPTRYDQVAGALAEMLEAQKKRSG